MKTRARKSIAAEEIPDSPQKVIEASPKKKKAETLVADLLSEIKETNAATKTSQDENKVRAKPKSTEKILRGIPKSGRPWKVAKQKFSTIKKTVHRRTFEKKEQLRVELKHIKELSKSIKEDKKLENVAKKQRRAENAQRRLANERKNEVVQVIKNTAKMKRMKKKALRKIEKRDLTSKDGPKVV